VPNERAVLDAVEGDFKSFKAVGMNKKPEIGTEAFESWEYEPPYSILGKILDVLKIKKDMKNYLIDSHRQMKEVLEK